MLPATPSQTVGPFFHDALAYEGGDHVVRADDPDAICIEGRVLDGAGEVHLRDEARRERRAEQRQVDVRRAPGVVVVLPRVGAGLDRDDPVAAIVVAEAAPGAREVRVERRRMAIKLVDVAPGGIRLPDLDQGVSHGPAVAVEHAPGDDDALTERLARMLAREVVVERAHLPVPVDGPGDLGKRVRKHDQRSLRGAQAGADVIGIQVRRMLRGVVAAVADHCCGSLISASRSGSFSISP